VGLARTLFAWTLHPIVYFWLIPAYIAMYTIVPKEAGGRLLSDEMARIAFIMLLVFSLPIGFHHLYVDPFQSAGFKLFHGIGTFMVAVPTFITVFTVLGSLEIAGRLRGGTGLFGWLEKLDRRNPMVLAAMLSLIMLGLGGFGGVVNASYQMNTMVHNTMWVPAHFHLMFGGGTIIMYFAIGYWLWPKLSGGKLYSARMAVWQVWLWFIGMLTLTIPWHYVGLLWMPRRTAFMPYDPQFVAHWFPESYIMGIGGIILGISSLMFVWNLLLSHGKKEPVAEDGPTFALAVHQPVSVPKSMNGFALWNWILVFYMIAAFGYPIAQFWLMGATNHNALPWGW
jgi:cytochrome c oxidase subunit 1